MYHFLDHSNPYSRIDSYWVAGYPGTQVGYLRGYAMHRIYPYPGTRVWISGLLGYPYPGTQVPGYPGYPGTLVCIAHEIADKLTPGTRVPSTYLSYILSRNSYPDTSWYIFYFFICCACVCSVGYPDTLVHYLGTRVPVPVPGTRGYRYPDTRTRVPGGTGIRISYYPHAGGGEGGIRILYVRGCRRCTPAPPGVQLH